MHGIDLTPPLLERARENSRIGGVSGDWREGDVEELPLADGEFDFVLSQFAHMFAPQPELAISEMLRVLKPGGAIAFATWPPEVLVGHTMALGFRYMHALPPDFSSPVLLGDSNIVKERLRSRVTNLVFARGCLSISSLSPQHFREHVQRTAGPIIKLVNMLSANAPDQLRSFRQQFDNTVSRLFCDNLVRQDYLLSRALKSL